MTLDEIRKAKQSAEARIRAELRLLEKETGMQCAGLRLDTSCDAAPLGTAGDCTVQRVEIDLRIGEAARERIEP